MVDADAFSLFLSLVIVAALVLAVPVAKAAFDRQTLGGPRGASSDRTPEFYALLLLASAGMLLVVSTRNLVLIFVVLEALSIGVYAIAGWLRGRPQSLEAWLEYFFYGACGAAFLLGIAIFYGVSGSADLARIEGALLDKGTPVGALPVAALALLLVGLAHKVASAPFHGWAPTVATGFMSVSVMTAAVGVLLRTTGSLVSLTDEWRAILWVLAVLSIGVGNLVAIVQDDIKRLLAYSGVAHGGYLLIGVLAGGETGRAAVLYYLLGYVFMSLGAFAVAVSLGKGGEENLSIRGWGGLGWKYPLRGAAMSLFMLSLAGIPATVGFMGKFYVFSAAMHEGYLGLVVIAVINTLISVYYYLRVVRVLYMDSPVADPGLPPLSSNLGVPVLVCSLGTLLLGLLPGPWLSLARRAALELF
jgi:NADH-quinone oxidoreductase subunit N